MKYRGKYNLKSRLLKEAFVEIGANNSDGSPKNTPEKWKVYYDKDTLTVKSYKGTKTFTNAKSAEGHYRAVYGLSQQKWAAELLGGASLDKLIAGDDDVTIGDGDNKTSVSVKAGSSGELRAPINKGEEAEAAKDPAGFARQFLQDEGGSVYDPGTQQSYDASHYDFSKARIGGYGGGGRKAVLVPAG